MFPAEKNKSQHGKVIAERKKIINSIPEKTFLLRTNFPRQTKRKTDGGNLWKFHSQLTIKADEKCGHVVDGDH